MQNSVVWYKTAREIPHQDLQKAFETTWFKRSIHLVRGEENGHYTLCKLSLLGRIKRVVHDLLFRLKIKKRSYFSTSLNSEVQYLRKVSQLNKFTQSYVPKIANLFNGSSEKINSVANPRLGACAFNEQMQLYLDNEEFPISFESMDHPSKKEFYSVLESRALETDASDEQIKIFLGALENKWKEKGMQKFGKEYIRFFPFSKAIIKGCKRETLKLTCRLVSLLAEYLSEFESFVASDGERSPLYNSIAGDKLPEGLKITFHIARKIEPQRLIWASVLMGMGRSYCKESFSDDDTKALAGLLEGIYKGKSFVGKSDGKAFGAGKYSALGLLLATRSKPKQLLALKSHVEKKKYASLWREVIVNLAVSNDSEGLLEFTRYLWSDPQTAQAVFKGKGFAKKVQILWSFRDKELLERFKGSIPDGIDKSLGITNFLENGIKYLGIRVKARAISGK